jgi:hypothetical protein
MNFRSLALLAFSLSVVLPYAASQTAARTPATSALTAVPPLVSYSGQVEGRTGQVPVTFLIYKDQTGGEPLFAESQIVSFDHTGHYNTQLGVANSNGLPLDLFSTGEARWLEIQVAGEPSQPRVLLTSVPYALKAADAATLGGLPASAYALAGNMTSANATSAAITPDASTAVTTTGGTANTVAKFSGSHTIVNSSIYDNGTEVGIGTTAPTATLTVNGSLTVNGATIQNNQVLFAQEGTAISSAYYGSHPLKFNASAYNSSTKKAVTPRFQMQAEAIKSDTSSPNGTLNLLASSGTPALAETGLYFNTNGIIHFAPGQTFQNTTNGITSVAHDSSLTGSGTTGSPLGIASVKTDSSFTGNGTSTSPLAFSSAVTMPGTLTTSDTINTTTSSDDGIAVISSNAVGNGIYASGSGSIGYGVYATGYYGIFASGTANAGYFSGNVYVSGTLSKAGGSFKIDHPLDPENKYLSHSFVESPDMMNIYNGNVVTDASGTAIVTMPDYFDALNRDFRYQLTVVGEQFAQARVASKMVNRSFIIKTDKPNVEISWQVTGIRQDAWANANRIPVEQEKTDAEKGRYLHPELFGHNGQLAIGEKRRMIGNAQNHE